MASILPFPIRCPISHPTESLLLHDAAAKGRLETTQFLVRQKGQGPNESDRDGNAPLHHAAYNGRLETVAFLAEHSDPDIRGNHGWTPLHFASREGHLEVAKHLVETCRARVSVEENGGRNAVDLAACSGNLELIHFLTQQEGLESGHQCNSGCTALHYAAYEGDLEIIRYLASEWRVSVLSKDNRGNTALHYSAIAGHADAVELFTKEINCDPNVQNAKGDSPLHIACRESHLKVVQVLAKQFHVNRALKNEVGQTPLEIAIAENAQAIIEALQSTKPIADVEPPAKKSRLDEVRLNSSQDQESRPVSSGHEEYSQPPSKTGSPPPIASSTADSHSTDVQNPRHREAAAEGSPEPLDPMEDESDEPSLSLSTIDMPPEFHAKLMPFVKKHAKLTGTTLGIGTYGSVEEIDIRGRLYAGKVFKVKEKNKFYKHLCSEICIISNLEHPNIVKYCGVCVIANIPLPVLLMERLENNLHDYILTPPNANIELSVKQLILRDVSCGLEYLHSHEAKVIHRDLTTKNVLLDSNLCAKITDFGNARIINLDTYMFLETMTARPGTIEYMPPEAFEEGCKYTTKLDIFSFGHMALVTAIQENVHPLLSHTYTKRNERGKKQRVPRTEENRRRRFVDRLFEVVGPVEHPLTDLILRCLHNQPDRRPTAVELHQDLKKMCMSSGNTSTVGAGEKLDSSDVRTVIDYLHPLQKDSVRQLALVLGIHTETLNDWNTSNARAFLEHVVEAWVRGQDGVEVATWKRLVEALRDETVGHTGIANKIEKEQLL